MFPGPLTSSWGHSILEYDFEAKKKNFKEWASPGICLGIKRMGMEEFFFSDDVLAQTSPKN